MTNPELPQLIRGLTHADKRGLLHFNNSFDPSNFVRSYIIENSDSEPMRGWHGHKHESKAFMAIKGSVIVGGVKIDDWNAPSSNLPVHSEELTEGSLSVFLVPPGYANAIRSLTTGSRVLVFSSSSLQDSLADDFRFPVASWKL